MALINSSYGAPIFDEAKLTDLFTKIGQLEVQEVGEAEAMYSTALATATAARLASQQARANAVLADIKTKSQAVIDAVTTKSAGSNAIIAAYPAQFTTWLRNFFYSDATTTSAARAMTVMANYAAFPAGADRYPATSNTARDLFKTLAGLFTAITYNDVYAALYPKG